MRCVRGLFVPRCSGIGVEKVRQTDDLSVFVENRWSSVSGTFGLTDQEVGFVTCSMYGTCETVFSYHLSVLDSV